MSSDEGRDSGSQSDCSRDRLPLGRRDYLQYTGAVAGGLTVSSGIVSADSQEPENKGEDSSKGGPPRKYSVSRYELNENGMGNAQTNTPPFCPRLITYNGRQYFAYWTHPGELVVAARNLPDGEWEQNNTGIQIDVRDGHWTPAVGLGPKGHIFLSYNTRSSKIRWRRSTSPEDISSFSDERVGMTGQNESSATYPEFTRLLDGTLLFGYRQGGSGNGDWILNRWNSDENAWRPLQHPLTDGQSGDQTYNSYHWNLVQSGDNVLHYFFTWRGTGGVQTNEDLLYARSPDGGVTWTGSDGMQYDLPITKETAEVVDDIPPGSDFINNGWASYDPRNGAPHVAYYRDDETGNTQIFHAYLNDGSWIIESVTDRETSVNFGGGGVIGSPISRMGIVVGDDGGVHILSRDMEKGGWPTLYTKARGEWHARYIYKRNLTYSDIHIDPYRWREDRVLSFIDQQQTVGNTSWTPGTLIGITDIAACAHPSCLPSADEDLKGKERFVTFASTPLAFAPETTANTSFQDTSTALAFTETSVHGTPLYARLQVELASSTDDGTARARVKIHDDSGSADVTLGNPVGVTGGPATRTSGWTEVPRPFRAGFANIQIVSSADAEARLLDGTLELAYVDPTPHTGQRYRKEGDD